MKADELFYSLGDVAAGKRTLEDVCKEMHEKDKERFKQLLNAGKVFLSSLKNNVKQNIKEETTKNDMAAKYDLKSAVTVEINGKKMLSAKRKEKQSWWKRLKTETAQRLTNMAAVLEGRKSFSEGLKDDIKISHDLSMNESKAYRKGYSAINGTVKGVKQTLNELRGVSQNKNDAKKSTADKTPLQPQNPYETLQPEQLTAAMGIAYRNIVWMQNLGSMPESEKAKYIEEVQKIIDVAQKRFPDIKPENKGSYFENPNIQGCEAKLFACMKANAATSDDVVFKQEVAKYTTWRNNEDYVEKGPMLTIREAPFQNLHLYRSAEDRKDPVRDDVTIEYLQNPYHHAKNALTKSQLAAERAKVAALNIR